MVERCPSCKHPRPPEDLRPPWNPPDVEETPENIKFLFGSVHAVGMPSLVPANTDYAKDPEWMRGDAIIDLPPAQVTDESQENMRILREVNAALDFDKDMSRGQAQRDLDTEIMKDFVKAAGDLACVTYDPSYYELPEAKKAMCPGPRCPNRARENSPYCSKICSDRCGRIRRKSTEAALTGEPLSKEDSDKLCVILKALSAWESRGNGE
jgi:hypothetical protein